MTVFWYSLSGRDPEFAGYSRQEAEQVQEHICRTEFQLEENVWLTEAENFWKAEENFGQYWLDNKHLFYWADAW